MNFSSSLSFLISPSHPFSLVSNISVENWQRREKRIYLWFRSYYLLCCTRLLFSQELFTQTCRSLVYRSQVKFRSQSSGTSKHRLGVEGVSYIADYIGGNKYFGEKRECSIFKANLGGDAKKADKDAASCSLQLPSNFHRATNLNMHESEKVEAELGYVARMEESEDEWVVSRTISLSPKPLFPPRAESADVVDAREDESVNLPGLSRCAVISFSQRECVARIGIRGEIVVRIFALEMPRRD